MPNHREARSRSQRSAPGTVLGESGGAAGLAGSMASMVDKGPGRSRARHSDPGSERGVQVQQSYSVERTIRASPAAVFALVADAARHPDIDGSGTVRRLRPGATRMLSLGAVFGMEMRVGVRYSMRNEVVEFEPDRRIAWRTTLAGALGRWAGGRIWRYELEEVAGGTRLRETWDISGDRQRWLLGKFGTPRHTVRNMTLTLERIAELTEPRPTEGAPGSV